MRTEAWLWLWKWASACWTYETTCILTRALQLSPCRYRETQATGTAHPRNHHILKSFPIKMGNHCFKRVMVKREFTGCYAGIALKWTDTLPASSIIGPGQPHSSKLAPDFTRDRVKLTQLLMYLLEQADILKYKYHQEDMRGLRM